MTLTVVTSGVYSDFLWNSTPTQTYSMSTINNEKLAEKTERDMLLFSFAEAVARSATSSTMLA